MTTRKRSRTLAAGAMAIGLTAACGGGPASDSGTVPPAAAESPLVLNEKWRAKHETDYRRDWVTIAGLHPLKQGVNTAGSAASNDIVLPAATPGRLGRFVRDDRAVRFEPAAGAAVVLNGQAVTQPVELRDDRTPKADELVIGDVRLVVHVSGETKSLRVRDPNGELARGFLGFRWFPIDLQYRVVGRFIKDAQPQAVKVLNTFGELDEFKSEGVVEFTPAGRNAPAAAVHDTAEALLFRVQGRVERPGNIRGGALPVCRPARRWNDRAGLQPGVQPAVRVQPLHDMSHPDSGESAASQDPRRREGLSHPRPTRCRRKAVGSDRGQTRVRPGSDQGQTGVRPALSK